MAGGRPTEYNQELIDKAEDYLTNYADAGDLVPTIAGLACVLGVHRDTLYDWAAQPEKQEFSYILKMVMQYQERKLVNGGLSDVFNASITKMMLTKHGYSDKQEVDHSSSDGSMRPVVNVSFDDPDRS
jgi:hypothetical protein